MKDLDDKQIKAEIDEIMKGIENIMEKVERMDPAFKDATLQNED
jgi:hypothetical protein